MNVDDQRPPIRVAVMGLGRAFFNDHYPFFKANPSLFTIVCACDMAKDRRDRVEKDFPNTRMYRTFADMLEERDIDLVDIATPTPDHVKDVMLSLQKGLWTLVESPLTLTTDDAQVIRGQAMRASNHLIVMQRGVFAPEFMLAQKYGMDARLGAVYDISITVEDYVRRDDWQAVKRMGGGASYYALPDLVLQTLKLLPSPPVQMWSDLKRIASLGDAEDFVRVLFKTRELVSASIEFNGGAVSSNHHSGIVIRGDRGMLSIPAGSREGAFTIIEPGYKFPRRRSSVRQPPLEDLHEQFPLQTIPVSLPETKKSGLDAFWSSVYDTVRTAAPFPLQIEDSIEAVKFSQLMKKTSPFGK